MEIRVFRRVEKKYILDSKTYDELMNRISDHLKKDIYYESNILNIYYDTDNYDLIINSIEKPPFKEKIRLRSYGIPDLESDVFLEIKSKYQGIVGKRRVAMKLKDFYKYLYDGTLSGTSKQIMKEMDYFFKKYKLKPKIFLGYNRYSYLDKDNPNLRITFDYNIRSRDNNLKLDLGDEGNYILPKDKVIMEIKSLDAIPIWLVKVLSELKIYPDSFSKYGNVYTKMKGRDEYV